MSEVANGFIKVLAQLTTPKAALKYILISTMLLISVTSNAVSQLGIPNEYVGFTLILFSIGSGSLMGELLNTILDFVWNTVKAKLSEHKNQKDSVNQSREKESKRIELVERLKAEFPIRLKALSPKEKEQLKIIYFDCEVEGKQSGSKVSYSSMGQGKLFSLGFLNVVEAIDSGSYIVEINPKIYQRVKDWLEEGLDKEIEDFLMRVKNTDISLIRLLDINTSDTEKNLLAKDLRPYLMNFLSEYSTACITAFCHGTRGMTISVSPLYKELIEKKLNVKLRSSVVIKIT